MRENSLAGKSEGHRTPVEDSSKRSNPLSRDPKARALLLKILQSKHGEDALVALLETGALEALVPEFKALRGRTIFDLYHTFSVDLHSIHTVSELKKLEEAEPEAFARVGDRHALFFAAFLHDIGKGAGSDHASRGGDMARPAAQAFGFDHARAAVVASLVRNHLVMADIATKRDLSDEKVIGDLAHRVGSPAVLSMLYLITIADSRATGPNAWSEWKASLLRELYLRTLRLLEQGIMRDRKTATRLEERWHKLVEESKTEAGASLAGRFWALPQAYVHATDLADIRSHLALSARLKGPDDLLAEFSKSRGHTRITVVTRDRPGLFALLTGILAINRMDV
ncbi:MAG TPA: HD domain-containing protein, partial [Deltaproteobacteria bacterium]|nr:HD domain-containing protein [Deltaproteobacteria bacterium]